MIVTTVGASESDLRARIAELESKLAAEKTKKYQFEASVNTEPTIEVPAFNISNGKKYDVMVYDNVSKKTIQRMDKKPNPKFGRLQMKLPHTVSVQNLYWLSEIEEILAHSVEIRQLIADNREIMAEAERAYIASK